MHQGTTSTIDAPVAESDLSPAPLRVTPGSVLTASVSIQRDTTLVDLTGPQGESLVTADGRQLDSDLFATNPYPWEAVGEVAAAVRRLHARLDDDSVVIGRAVVKVDVAHPGAKAMRNYPFTIILAAMLESLCTYGTVPDPSLEWFTSPPLTDSTDPVPADPSTPEA